VSAGRECHVVVSGTGVYVGRKSARRESNPDYALIRSAF
jgi:hypothetical protein